MEFWALTTFYEHCTILLVSLPMEMIVASMEPCIHSLAHPKQSTIENH